MWMKSNQGMIDSNFFLSSTPLYHKKQEKVKRKSSLLHGKHNIFHLETKRFRIYAGPLSLGVQSVSNPWGWFSISYS